MVILVIIYCGFAKTDHLFDIDISESHGLLLYGEGPGLMKASCDTWHQCLGGGEQLPGLVEAFEPHVKTLNCNCFVEFVKYHPRGCCF